MANVVSLSITPPPPTTPAVSSGQLPRKAVPFYNTAHRTWIPLALAGAYTLAPLDAPAVFTFLLGWMLHIAVDRIAGYNLRSKDGFIRA
jgi:hypothetical protein